METGQRAGNGSILWVLGSRLHSEAAPAFLSSKLKPKAVLLWNRMWCCSGCRWCEASLAWGHCVGFGLPFLPPTPTPCKMYECRFEDQWKADEVEKMRKLSYFVTVMFHKEGQKRTDFKRVGLVLLISHENLWRLFLKKR